MNLGHLNRYWLVTSVTTSCVGLHGPAQSAVSPLYDVRPPCAGLGMLFSPGCLPLVGGPVLQIFAVFPRGLAFELSGVAADAGRSGLLFLITPLFFGCCFWLRLLFLV